MQVVSVGSSSSGNSYIIRIEGGQSSISGYGSGCIAGKPGEGINGWHRNDLANYDSDSSRNAGQTSRTIILDVGLPCKTIMAALEELGIAPEEVDAVLITHEHTDHVKSVRAVAGKCRNAVFYTSRGTYAQTANFVHVPEERVRFIRAGESFSLNRQPAGSGCTAFTAELTEEIEISSVSVRKSVTYEEIMLSRFSSPDGFRAAEQFPCPDDVVISAFALSHDAAEPLGYTITAGGEKLAVVTDTGIITEEIYDAIYDADMLIFESNHDEDMLMYGEYPYHLKVRIRGDYGHLSNDYAGEVLTRILLERSQRKDDCRNSDLLSDVNESDAAAHGSAGRHAEVISEDAAEADKSACGFPNSAQADIIAAAETAGVSSASFKPLRIMLAHLSFHNNMPLFARQTVEEYIAAADLHRGRDYLLEVAAKEGLTFMPDA